MSTAPAASPPQPPRAIPWLGILAVLLGLFASILLGQMLAGGASDLSGAMHLTRDQAAWMGPVYNAGQMFVGPLSVYLGGIFGFRRVLLVASAVAAVTAAIAPLAFGFGYLMVVLAVLGLACGVYYPLSLTFVSQHLPPKLMLFGIWAYVIDALVTVHLSSFMEGATMRFLSWRWLLWGSILLTLPACFCVYRGMPAEKPLVDADRLRPTWAGFLYASLGLSLLFLLLTQGDRLDWWRSGVIVAMLVCGLFFLGAAAVQHALRPNPMVTFSILRRRNILLLSLCLCVVRFSILASALIVPEFLGTVGGLLPLQFGTVLAWASIPTLVCALVAALSLAKLDPRVVLASGFALECASSLVNVHLSSSWSRGNFFTGELLLGAGAAVAVCGLIGSIVLEMINIGIAKNPVQVLTFVAWFHTVRLFGGQLATTPLTHFITVRQHFHAGILAQGISQGRHLVQQQVGAAALAAHQLGAGASSAIALAGAGLGLRVQVQAMTLSMKDAYVIEAIVLACAVAMVASLRREPMQMQDLAKQRKANG